MICIDEPTALCLLRLLVDLQSMLNPSQAQWLRLVSSTDWKRVEKQLRKALLDAEIRDIEFNETPALCRRQAG